MELNPVQRRIRDFYFKEGLGASPDITHVHRPSLVPDQGQNLFTVDFCNGTNLSLSHTTAVDTGNDRNCSAGSKCSGSGDPCSEDGDCPALETCNICYFGAPLPILDTAIAALSTCVINTISRDSKVTPDWCRRGSVSSSWTCESQAFQKWVVPFSMHVAIAALPILLWGGRQGSCRTAAHFDLRVRA